MSGTRQAKTDREMEVSGISSGEVDFYFESARVQFFFKKIGPAAVIGISFIRRGFTQCQNADFIFILRLDLPVSLVRNKHKTSQAKDEFQGKNKQEYDPRKISEKSNPWCHFLENDFVTRAPYSFDGNVHFAHLFTERENMHVDIP